MKYIKSFEQFVNEKNENQEFFDQIDAISEELGDDQLNEARGFTIRELRLKALDLLRGLGIKNPSDNDISDMIETIKTFIKGHNLGVVMG